jgi:predicted 3-demethylubiquinone-9 3-methyltransferase (glyoxalase superfamily)
MGEATASGVLIDSGIGVVIFIALGGDERACKVWRRTCVQSKQQPCALRKSWLSVWDGIRHYLIEQKEHTNMKPKNTICLWFDKDAHEAARFYAATFPDSEVTAVHEAPGDYPGGKEGDVLTVEFTVLGVPCLGLNGGPEFRHSEAFSFQIVTDNQEETDRYWNAIVGNGGQESQCGWCKDRWGLSWQITPRALSEALAAGGGEAKRAFEAMMPMKKIDIATIEAARRG